jgi:sodium transport system permease protein
LAAAIAVTVTAGLCAALLRFIPMQEMGMRFRFGIPHLVGMMAAVLPMCLVTAAVQSCVATLARSFKEAQSYMGILILAPMLVGVLGTLYPIDNQPWMYGVPMLGQYVLLTNVLGGRAPGVLAFTAAALTCVVVAAMFVNHGRALQERADSIWAMSLARIPPPTPKPTDLDDTTCPRCGSRTTWPR